MGVVSSELATSRLIPLFLMAFGAVYSFQTIRGDTAFIKAMILAQSGNYIGAVMGHQTAAAINPLPYRNREAEMRLMSSMTSVPPDLALSRIDKMLKDDPYGVAVNFYKVIHSLRLGLVEPAQKALERMEVSGPGWPLTMNARQIIKATIERES